MRKKHEIYDDEDEDRADKLLGYTVDVVTAHLAHNNVALADVPGFIYQVHGTLAGLGGEPAEAKPEPIVSIAASVKPDYIICLDCGRKMKTLKAHLRTRHNMEFDDYCEKWGLPASYPSVAANFSSAMRARAISMGLPERMRAVRDAKRQESGKPPFKVVKTGRKSA